MNTMSSSRNSRPSRHHCAPSLAAVAAACALAGSPATAREWVPPPAQWVGITAGASHTCATNNYGATYCWGRNDTGQVGPVASTVCRNNIECVERPRFVLFAAQVDAGANHNCAIDWAGRATCWGNDDAGQIGTATGNRTTRRDPTPVAGDLVFSSISAGTRSSCGSTSTGTFCWGEVASPHTLGTAYPTQMTQGMQGVSVDRFNFCVIGPTRAGPAAYCGGRNDVGQLGAPPAAGTMFVRSSFNFSVARVSVRDRYVCADQLTGIVQCLGSNESGQLGNGTRDSSYLAQTVGRGMALRAVTTGLRHACALDPMNQAWCWGEESMGQLGNGFAGSTTPPSRSLEPTRVLGGHTFRAIAAGGEHTCGIATDNRIWCWGSNVAAQLGAGILTTQLQIGFSIPQLVLDP